MANLTKNIEGIKWSPILHGIAATAGILGILALFSWWVSLVLYPSFFFSPEHAYKDAVIFFLTSITFGIGALIHQNKERK